MNAAELRSMVAEIAPVVAEVAGRSFASLPEVVLADERDLAEVILRERLHLLAATEGLSPEEIEAYRQRAAQEQLAPGFEGKYGFVDDRLYVSVDSVVSTLSRNRSRPSLLRPVLRVIIAHELAHALQDQHTPMEHLLRTAPGDDAVMAMNCAFEGHAVWVHEAVARRMGLSEAGDLMVDLMGYEAPITQQMSPDLFYSRYVYGMGRDFVAFHAHRGGKEEVWRVLRAPPETTAEIVAPERYPEEGVPSSEPLARALDRASEQIGDQEWQRRRTTIGDYDLRDQLIRAGGDIAIADGLNAGWSVASVGGADEGAQVQVLRFGSEPEAQAFVAQMLKRAVTQAEATQLLPFLEVEVGALDLIDSDLSAFSSMRLRMDEGPADRQDRLWVVRGADVVQILLVNVRPRKRRLAGVFRGVFRSLR